MERMIDVLNKRNVELYKKYNISDMESKIYRCFLCRRFVCLSESTSIKGAYLVCKCCVYNEFGSWEATKKWQFDMKKRYDS